jgi:hypothetical protein
MTSSFPLSFLITPELTPQEINYKYASEADMLNMALFGKTAKQWREETGIKNENMRDYASIEQLIILVNIESLNADMIRDDIPMGERLKKLRSVAYHQITPFSFSHFSTCGFALFTLLPFIGRPFFSVAPFAAFATSRSLPPMPLPSCVQSGRMVFPVKSNFSRNVNTAIGQVPQ